MPAYHSQFNEFNERVVGGMSLLPLKTRIRGPAPPADPSSPDIVDEAIDLFRANIFFRNYSPEGPADRLLIYFTLFISECISRIGTQGLQKGWSKIEATKQLLSMSVDNFAIPGDATFPMNILYERPTNRMDADVLRQYLQQARQELATRLVEKLYDTPDGKPSKWWLAFQKRAFMGKKL